jgi:hypothetical protein
MGGKTDVRRRPFQTARAVSTNSCVYRLRPVEGGETATGVQPDRLALVADAPIKQPEVEFSAGCFDSSADRIDSAPFLLCRHHCFPSSENMRPSVKLALIMMPNLRHFQD